jgi:ATP-dependent RNA helicase RhlE
MTFTELALAEPVLRAVSAEGYTTPTPIQAQSIPHILEGRDLLGTAQTGTGKTAAFALPVLHRLLQDTSRDSKFRKPRVLVISPTRELATQISDSFRTYGRHTGLRETVVFGGVSQVPQVRTLRRGVDILVATPGRLLDLFNQGCIRLEEVSILVLDEADRMLDMGFMPDIRRIIENLPKEKQTLLFSATMPPAIQKFANELLRHPAEVRIAPAKPTTDLIAQAVCHVPQGQKPYVLAAYLTSQSFERAIVFTRTKQSAERVAQRLCRSGLPADAIHGNKTQAARQRALAAFRSNHTSVLVATDVAARGLDVDGISHVVNYDLPMEPETYVHRIGRTGRAGATGVAMSFCDGEQRRLLHAIERLLNRKLPVEQIATSGETSALAMPSSPPEPREPSSAPPRQNRPPKSGDRPGKSFRPKGPQQGGRPEHRRPGKPRPGKPRSEQTQGERRPHAAASSSTSSTTTVERREGSSTQQTGSRPAQGKRPFFGKKKSGGWRASAARSQSKPKGDQR